MVKKRKFHICCGRCSSLDTIVSELGFKCLECGFFVALDEMMKETITVKEVD